LYAILASAEGWYDSDGNVIEPPIKGMPYKSSPGSQQVNPDFLAEAHISNDLRQILYEPVPIAHDGAGYNASFLYRVCVTAIQGDTSRDCEEYSDFTKVTMVVDRHNLPPVAVAPSTTTLREGMDATHGVTLTLGGTDPEGTAVTPAVVRTPGVAASCGDGGVSCGTLYQVDWAGKPGAAFSPSSCTYNSPCFVTDPHRRVIFVPAVTGRDASGPFNPAYCTVQFVVSDGSLLSTPADRPNRRAPRLRGRRQRRGITPGHARH
jgi:hypothetical protein